MYVIINGVSSDTIQGLQVLSLPPITKPKMRWQVDTIDGRDGDIITELGYEAYDRTITVLLHHNYDLDAITAFFNTSGEIIFSNEPDKKYNFRLLEKIDYERAVQFKTANITFHVQPYKYPVNETPLTVSSVAWEGTDYDKTPYIFRAVSDSSVDVGNREIVEQITGGTVAFNQLCNASSVTIASGRKYYMKKGTAYSIGASTGAAITGLTSGSDMLIDITQMFGSTIADYIYSLEQSTAGAGVSLFKSLFPKDYYAYNPGELISAKTSARETVGKNLYPVKKNVIYSNAGINVTTDADGVITIKGTATAQVDYCPLTGASGTGTNLFSLLPGTYRIKATGLPGTGLLYIFGGSGSQISYAQSANDVDASRTMTSYGATGYNIIRIPSGTTVDATIRIQWQYEDMDTSYEPYEKHTYPLSPIELRGIPKLVNNKIHYDGDIYKSDGSVARRYKLYTYNGTEGGWSARTAASGGVPYFNNGLYYANEWNTPSNLPSENIVNDYIRCNMDVLHSYSWIDRGNHGISIGNGLRFSTEAANPDTMTLDQFKTWLSTHPIQLVAEIKSPTTETTTPYTETQICSPYGTEEFIDSRDVQIPVGHKTRYKQINDPAEIIVPNAGNVPSAPTIQLTGSGTVGVYLGNAQTLQVNIPEDGITIDTEAQDATSNGQLANRSVTGDYDSVRLQPGDNDVSFSGDVSAVITNYTRWV